MNQRFVPQLSRCCCCCWRAWILVVVATIASLSGRCHGFLPNRNNDNNNILELAPSVIGGASHHHHKYHHHHHHHPLHPRGDQRLLQTRRQLRDPRLFFGTKSFCASRHNNNNNNSNNNQQLISERCNIRGGQMYQTESAEEQADTISQRGLIINFGLFSLSLTTALAVMGVLPGPLFAARCVEIVPYTNAYVLRDVGMTLLTTALAYALARGITFAFEAGYLDSKDSRKLIHTLSAPLFILFWPLFSPATGSQAFAALVALVNALRLFLASKGTGERSLAMAVSRSGNRNEALGGPFIYVCIVFVCIVAFWRCSPAGLVALCTMAVGDGLADLVGRRFGKNNQWPCLKKSVAGSTAFWIGSTCTIVGTLQWMQYWNCLTFASDFTTTDLWIRAAVVGLATAAFELVPVGDDNYSVPLAGAVLGMLLFPVVVA